MGHTRTPDLRGVPAGHRLRRRTRRRGRNLETKASEDDYRFTLTAGQTVYVDVTQCPSSVYLSWKLVNDATGAQVGSSGGCYNGQVNNLPAGTYRIVVTPMSERTGTYALTLRSG